MQESSKNIIECLDRSHIRGTEIFIRAKVNDLEFDIKNKDIMGGLIQSWFEKFLDKNGIKWHDRGTQTYPDFILENNEYLEVKCYFKDATPAFDLANFKSFIDSVIKDPKRLNSDYLVFNYNFDDTIGIHDYFCKKIWEMTADHSTGKYKGQITAQVKKGTIVNLRPYNFIKYPERSYDSRYSFVKKIQQKIRVHSKQLINEKCEYRNDEEWFDILNKRYSNFYNQDL